MPKGNYAVSPTGRHIYYGSVTGRSSSPLPLTEKQREILSRLVDDQVQVGSRIFNRAELFSAFKGECLPKDPEICVLLDLSKLEQRVVATFGLDPNNPYGSPQPQSYSTD